MRRRRRPRPPAPAGRPVRGPTRRPHRRRSRAHRPRPPVRMRRRATAGPACRHRATTPSGAARRRTHRRPGSRFPKGRNGATADRGAAPSTTDAAAPAAPGPSHRAHRRAAAVRTGAVAPRSQVDRPAPPPGRSRRPDRPRPARRPGTGCPASRGPSRSRARPLRPAACSTDGPTAYLLPAATGAPTPPPSHRPPRAGDRCGPAAPVRRGRPRCSSNGSTRGRC